jgi:biopolymer transport protein TolR
MQMQGSGGRTSRRSGRRRKKNTALISEINVTPFVDVMLVLLIIFMVTAPLLTPGVVVDLPEADTAPLPGKDEPLEITVDKKGQIYLSKTKISLDEIGPKLDAITKRKLDTRIFVRGDKTVDYGKMISVMGAINKAGYNKVGLVTDQPSG